jgi:hypothetical protein
LDENPYQSPQAEGSPQTEGEKAPLFRTLSRRAQFLIGCAALAPVSWLLGRGLIPPDDVALRFSVAAWPVLATVWGSFVWRKRLIGRKPSVDDPWDVDTPNR